MEKEKKVKINQSRLFIIIGSFLFLIGLGLFVGRLYYIHFLNQRDEMSVEEFFETDISSNISDTSSDENQERQEIYHYIGVLEIPKIKFQRGFFSIDDKNNDIEKNIQVMDYSDMPNIKNGNLVISGHTGNSRVGFFTKLSQLDIGDLANVYYDGIKYVYQLENRYERQKTGKIEIIKDDDQTCLTLITCDINDNTKQVVYIFKLTRSEKY